MGGSETGVEGPERNSAWLKHECQGAGEGHRVRSSEESRKDWLMQGPLAC